ncbi:hypothetical protein IFM47457_10710 [Aspergillus lentulus]|nr:hypothetical protein IFM47457_10710 [Aspergillus lentulus]
MPDTVAGCADSRSDSSSNSSTWRKREENVQLHLQLQQLSHGLEELRGENAQLREVGRQLYLELLDGHLQQSQRPVEGHDDEKEEDGDQYP